MLLLIDNLDSFSYNLVQLFQILGACVHVIRSPFFSLEQCLDLNPKHIVIGPGPGTPSEYAYFKSLVATFGNKTPILGVCLGHQGLAECYGGHVIKAKKPIHGKTGRIHHSGKGIFTSLPQDFLAVRYNSLIVCKNSIPSCLEVTAYSDEEEIMAFKHRHHQIEGVQFHPESIGSEYGHLLFQNFLNQSI